MASNVWLTDDIITLEALSVFENELVAAKYCDRKYEALFGTHGGSNRSDTIRVRKPNQYTVQTGRPFSAQNITDDYVSFAVDSQIHVDTEIYSDEFTQDLSSFSDQVLKPQMVQLANYVDVAVLTAMKQTHNAVGTAGTVPTALSTYLDAGVKLDYNGCPRGRTRHCVIGPQMQASLVDATKGLFNSQSKVGDQYTSGEMGYVAGLNFAMDQNVQTHTVGAWSGAAPKIKGGGQTGASLLTDGWTATTSVLAANDIFTISGVYSVNPVSKASTGVLQQFRNLATATATAGAEKTITIYPSIVTSGATQTVSAGPADNADIVVLGNASTLTAQGIAWDKSAVALAFAPLPKPEGVHQASTKTDPKLGVSMRFIRWYDGDSDLWKARFDVKFGVKVLRPEWVCRIYSGAA